MIDVAQILEKMEKDVNDAFELADHLYNKYFGKYFHVQQDMYKRVQDADKPITDAELEQVLTELPLELIDVSETIAKFQLGEEVIKLRVKEEAVDKDSDDYKEYELMSKVYNSVNERVHRQTSFSRELIMSCKKIWDRRKETDVVTPIGPVDTSLPEYTPPTSGQSYIR